jgi:alkyl sulfatase BDS1-like metallo-beta-lactamase superfamily hydrolase
MKLNFDFGDQGGKYLVELENGVLNNTAEGEANDADTSISLSRDTLDSIVLGETKLDAAVKDGKVKITGDADKLTQLVSMLDNFEFWFNIVTP